MLFLVIHINHRAQQGRAVQSQAIICNKSDSGEEMILALLVAGILAVVVALLVIFSAMQDIDDDY